MIPNPHPCAPPLPIIGAVGTGLLVIAIVCAVLVAAAIVAFVNRHRVTPGVSRAALGVFWWALIAGVVAGGMSAVLLIPQC